MKAAHVASRGVKSERQYQQKNVYRAAGGIGAGYEHQAANMATMCSAVNRFVPQEEITWPHMRMPELE